MDSASPTGSVFSMPSTAAKRWEIGRSRRSPSFAFSALMESQPRGRSTSFHGGASSSPRRQQVSIPRVLAAVALTLELPQRVVLRAFRVPVWRGRGQPMREPLGALEAERSEFSGICEQCGTAYRGRTDKRFCRDACRTKFGRERKAQELQATIERLTRLAGTRRRKSLGVTTEPTHGENRPGRGPTALGSRVQALQPP
jgi:hypothetical protein